MGDQFERAVEKVCTLPPEMQHQAAQIRFAFAGEEAVLILTPEEDADLAEAQDERLRGDFATDAEVAAVFDKYRR